MAFNFAPDSLEENLLIATRWEYSIYDSLESNVVFIKKNIDAITQVVQPLDVVCLFHWTWTIYVSTLFSSQTIGDIWPLAKKEWSKHMINEEVVHGLLSSKHLGYWIQVS